MSYEQEKELRLSFEPYTAATTGAVGKKKSIYIWSSIKMYN